MESKQRPNLQPSTLLISSDVGMLNRQDPRNYLIKPAFNLMHAAGLSGMICKMTGVQELYGRFPLSGTVASSFKLCGYADGVNS